MASDSKPEGSMLWGGRFTGGLEPLMVKYNESIFFDRILYKQDILGSIAFTRANAKSGIITQEEFENIREGLLEEDIHTANERRLGGIIAENVAGKLHTGRGRNEQVVCDMRMWLEDELRKIDDHLVNFLKVIAARAENEIEYIMPGYTHLQRAQPVRWSHWMLSYGLAFAADLDRLRETIKRVNRSPLGCGALAGNPFNIDRDMMAEELGFEGLLWNSMGGKKNTDSLELLRGKAGRAFGHMAGFMMTQKGLPSTYNKDLQESLEPMMDHVKTVSDSIQTANGVLATLTVNAEKMKAAIDPFMLATDVADYLVRKGVPFRETHHISGRCVAKSEETGIPMNEFSYEQIKAIDERFEEDIADVFN
ncbi:hypothetical protein CEP51_016079 [Fusarium floridanum]|uniref:Arginosuccinase n=1 Tax=Fusarium floridanum TaxID=1325733 RepID=A0A428NXI6_9HYPO|nr:hypothetical protein CEP51_016079 [Fusarium floridanum]